jgi:alpha-galactosidase
MKTSIRYLILINFFILTLFSCKKQDVKIVNNILTIEFNNKMLVKITNTAPGAKALMTEFSTSEYLLGKKFNLKEFNVNYSRESESNGIKSYTLSGTAKEEGILVEKIVDVSIDPEFPNLAVMNVKYINHGEKSFWIDGWVNNNYDIQGQGDKPNFWSFQGSSSKNRTDWILPVDSGYSKQNYMGMTSTDYGGGIPAIDLWRKDAGIMIGHAELVPRLVSLPVEMDKYDGYATIGIQKEYTDPVDFKPNDTILTYTTFVSVHEGDYFTAMQQYSKLMQKRGIKLSPSTPEAFEPVWCAWGYGRGFTYGELLGTLPKVKEMGIKWVDVDDGFQIAEGDWNVDPKKHAGGNAGMKLLIDAIHAQGMKAKLWWAPLAVDQGTELLKKDPDILIRRRDGSPQYITYWDSYYMSPTYKGTIEHTKEVINMFINVWGYDGVKMDGQHLNAIAPDYNFKRHGANSPEEVSEKLPEFFRMIKDEMTRIKPNAVFQICPCGDAFSFYNLPFTNQVVASDPTSSAQTRQKGKTFKALNPGLAYYGDHVELTDGGNDFASQLGIGAVLGTKFTWLENKNLKARSNRSFLTPEKETVWKKWFDLNRKKMLCKETYLGGLYDIGYDKPETHVIIKSDTLFYAFYADKWQGKIEFRGLSNSKYLIKDYVNNLEIGTITKDNPMLETSFIRNLLVEAIPLK